MPRAEATAVDAATCRQSLTVVHGFCWFTKSAVGRGAGDWGDAPASLPYEPETPECGRNTTQMLRSGGAASAPGAALPNHGDSAPPANTHRAAQGSSSQGWRCRASSHPVPHLQFHGITELQRTIMVILACRTAPPGSSTIDLKATPLSSCRVPLTSLPADPPSPHLHVRQVQHHECRVYRHESPVGRLHVEGSGMPLTPVGRGGLDSSTWQSRAERV